MSDRAVETIHGAEALGPSGDGEMPTYLEHPGGGYVNIEFLNRRDEMVVQFIDLDSWSLWHGFLILNYPTRRIMLPRETIKCVTIQKNSHRSTAEARSARTKASSLGGSASGA